MSDSPYLSFSLPSFLGQIFALALSISLSLALVPLADTR